MASWFSQKTMYFVGCFGFFFFTQLGIFSRVFLYAGANAAYSNNAEQKTECIMLFFKIKEIVHILESNMRWLIFRKISITTINKRQFLEKIYKIDFSQKP